MAASIFQVMRSGDHILMRQENEELDLSALDPRLILIAPEDAQVFLFKKHKQSVYLIFSNGRKDYLTHTIAKTCKKICYIILPAKATQAYGSIACPASSRNTCEK